MALYSTEDNDAIEFDAILSSPEATSSSTTESSKSTAEPGQKNAENHENGSHHVMIMIIKLFEL